MQCARRRKRETASNFRKTAATFQPGAKTLPQRYFVSPEIFAEELQKIFADQLGVGRPSKSARRTRRLFPCRSSRRKLDRRERSTIDDPRVLQCLSPSRGATLRRAKRTCRSDSVSVSRVDVWLDGRLLGAPHMDEMPGFNKADYPLKPARLGLWEGFIFVNLADASRVPLEKWFAPLGGKFSPWNLRSAALGETDRVRRAGQLEADLSKITRSVITARACIRSCRKFHRTIRQRMI